MKTTEARSWQNRAVKEIMRQSNIGLQDEFDPTLQYGMELRFYFERVINKGWEERHSRGKKKGRRKADNKWKKIDLSNRLKLLEDTLKDVTGVDDCATFMLFLVKECDPDNPRVEVELYPLPEV